MGGIYFRRHALDRMEQRSISSKAVREALAEGETIEEDTESTPFPSRLVLGYTGPVALHIVVSEAPDGSIFVVTAYRPDLYRWQPDWRTRRKP
ncbi:MAG: DUF4258 domain-containing protein [Armatimonadetes bacterium]|nr:DUF4258 domain-containing protein [Armatimonadota bacterium]